jgi:hypothetical protein
MFSILSTILQYFDYDTVKPVINSHPWDPQKVTFVRRWLLCRGFFYENCYLIWFAGGV